MKNKYIYFGETIEGYSIPVLNEREARAGSGILLVPAIASFVTAYLTHNFFFTKIFVTFFMIDFIIRIFINPKYSPSLILGRIFVQNQTPEYTGAAQKKFAWGLGLVLAIIMFLTIVVFEIMTPIKIFICLFCIALLFFETSFGICLGCITYNRIYNKEPQYCPGGVCEIKEKEDIQKISKTQYFILITSILILFYGFFALSQNSSKNIEPSMKCATGY